MAITDYPAGLPLAMRDGYSFSPTNNIVRTDMQSGRARQRVEFKNVPDTLKLKWTLTDLQSRLFGTWARNVVGAGWFTMTILTPEGFDPVEMRFTERVDGPALTGKFHWIWTATAEVRNMPELDGDWVLLPDYVLHADIFDYAMNVELPLDKFQIQASDVDIALNAEWPKP